MQRTASYRDWIRLAKVNARMPLLQARTTEALGLIDALIPKTRRSYVAFSGGKDSQVVLDLALQEYPNIDVVFHNEDWVLPGTYEHIKATERHYGIRIIRVRERHAADEYFDMFGKWPVHPSPGPVDYEADTWREIVRFFRFDGVVMGLRRDESVQRLFALKEPLRLTKADGLWHCSPLFNWNTETVWAYIASHNLPVHPAYERMIDDGHIDPHRARIGPLTAVRVWQYGMLDTVKRLWPEAWNEFAAANPEACA